MLAQIEPATKVMSAAHQGMCDARPRSLNCSWDLFRENLEDFWRSNKDCATDWNEEKFLQALNDCRLIPARRPEHSLAHPPADAPDLA
jgi:hypothetical protein